MRNVFISDRSQATIVLRESGHVDLYWNKKKISSTQDLDEPYKYTNIKVNYQEILLRRYSDNKCEHQVKLSLLESQRTSFENLTTIQDYDENEMSFFRNQKYKLILNPYQEIFLFNKTLLVAHGNVLSYYNMASNKWSMHHKFAEGLNDDGPADANQSFAFVLKKKVLRMFRYESALSDYSIGILFQDGTFKRIILNPKPNGQDEFHEMDVVD